MYINYKKKNFNNLLNSIEQKKECQIIDIKTFDKNGFPVLLEVLYDKKKEKELIFFNDLKKKVSNGKWANPFKRNTISRIS